MTPLALSGGCQASEMVCLVISLAWMEVTGDGADQRTEREGKMLKPVTLSQSPMLFSALETSCLFWPNPLSLLPLRKSNSWAGPRGNHFHLSLNMATIQDLMCNRAAQPNCQSRAYDNDLFLIWWLVTMKLIQADTSTYSSLPDFIRSPSLKRALSKWTTQITQINIFIYSFLLTRQINSVFMAASMCDSISSSFCCSW